MTDDFCWWCSKPVKVKFDRGKYKRVFCDYKCNQLNWLFEKWMSDDNLNRYIQEARNGQDKDES